MMGRDYTIFSVAEGHVSFEKRGKNKKLINVQPVAV